MVDAVVKEITWREGKKVRLSLDGPCPMHPEGGGQPGDSGRLIWNGGAAAITNTLKGEAQGVVLEAVVEKGDLLAGIEVNLIRDDDRNKILSRMHSAEHVLSRVMEKMRPGLSVYKVAIGEERTAVYLRYDGQIDWDFMFAAEKEAMSVVNSAIAVENLEVSIEEAKSMEGLKARWDRVEDQLIRVVRIPDFDLIACSGTHVSNTSQIGPLCVESIKGSAPEWEITFSLGDSFYLYSQEMRRLVSRVNCTPMELGKILDRLNEENQTMKKHLSKVASYVELPWTLELVRDLTVNCSVTVGLPADMLSICGRKKAADGGVVLVICDDGGSGPVPFMIWDQDQVLDIRALLSSPELEAKGGGKGGSISGRTGCRSIEKWLKAIESTL